MLSVDNISVIKDRKRILNRVSAEFSAESFSSVLGATGSGKSTLIRVLAGLERPDAGNVFLDGKDITATRASDRRAIAAVMQRPGLFPGTIRTNLEWAMRAAGVKRGDWAKQIQGLIKFVCLKKHADDSVDTLSGGEAARVALIRALAVRPRFLLIDESLSGVHPTLRRDIFTALMNYSRSEGLAVIFSTHDQADAFMFSSYGLLLEEGDRKASGSLEAMYRSPKSSSVSDFFGISTRFQGVVTSQVADGDTVEVKLSGLGRHHCVYARLPETAPNLIGRNVTVVIRPEDITLSPRGLTLRADELAASVGGEAFAGSITYVYLRLDDEPNAPLIVATKPREHLNGDSFKYVSLSVRKGVSAICNPS